MPITPRPKPRPPERPRTPEDVAVQLLPGLRIMVGFDAELDFSWARQAITICDMRIPSALRYGDLYTVHEIQQGEDRKPDDFARRVKAFMG